KKGLLRRHLAKTGLLRRSFAATGSSPNKSPALSRRGPLGPRGSFRYMLKIRIPHSAFRNALVASFLQKHTKTSHIPPRSSTRKNNFPQCLGENFSQKNVF